MTNSVIISTVLSQSMVPTLDINDRVLAYRFWPSGWLRKGDIVILKPQERNLKKIPTCDSDNNYSWLKRIVAIPGDEILVGSGYLSENNHYMLEKIVVPPKHFVVNGDANIIKTIPSKIGLIPFQDYQAIVFLKISGKNNKKTFTWISRDKT